MFFSRAPETALWRFLAFGHTVRFREKYGFVFSDTWCCLGDEAVPEAFRATFLHTVFIQFLYRSYICNIRTI